MLNKYMNNPDRAELKVLRHEFQFIEEADCYILILNEENHSTYPKSDYSELKAELEAADTVNEAIEKYGEHLVYYNGPFANFEKQIV